MDNTKFDIQAFIQTIPKETLVLISQAIDIYILIEEKRLELSNWESLILEENDNNIKILDNSDKVNVSLFVASLKVERIAGLMKKYRFEADEMLTHLSIYPDQVNEIDIDECVYLEYFEEDFLKELMPIIENKKEDELKKLWPEVILIEIIIKKSSLLYNYHKLCDNDCIMIEMVDDLEKLEKERQIQSTETISENTAFKTNENIDIPYVRNLNVIPYLDNPAIGREQELENIMISLLTDKKSPILVGPPGTGKTAIVEGLAYLLQTDNVPRRLKGKQIIEIDMLSLISGTKYRGEFEEKLQELIDVALENPDIILFIDEIHTIIGLGATSEDNMGMSNILKPYLSSGELKIIGATTTEEYENHFTKDSAFQRRLETIAITEPEEKVLKEILQSKISYLEEFYQITFPFSMAEQNIILDTIISSTNKKYRRYNTPNHNPDIAVKMLTKAFAIAALKDHDEITTQDIIDAMQKIDELTALATTQHAKELKQSLIQEKENEKTIGAKIIQFPNPRQ